MGNNIFIFDFFYNFLFLISKKITDYRPDLKFFWWSLFGFKS